MTAKKSEPAKVLNVETCVKCGREIREKIADPTTKRIVTWTKDKTEQFSLCEFDFNNFIQAFKNWIE